MLRIHLRKSLSVILFAAVMIIAGCATGGGSDSESDSNSSSPSSETSSGVVEQFSRSVSFCGTPEPDENTLANLSILFRQYRASRTKSSVKEESDTINIPVYFHVISKGDSAEEGEVSDSVLAEQIEIMNRAFSGITGGVWTPYRFSLAGIDRVRDASWHVMEPGSDSEFAAKEALKVGDAETLNIYIVDIQATAESGGSEGIILGYTTLPVFYLILAPYDGIVLHYKALPGGPLEHYNTGHVAVHETGHWLGLLHTFNGECDGFFDDFVSDTPREMTPEAGQFCPVDRDSCPSLEGVDPVHNHMTYTSDECRTEFTQGQVEFMEFNAMLFRGLTAG